METFSLADNIYSTISRPDLHAHEKFKTRMLRVDLSLRRSLRDPIQHFIRKGLRRFWYATNLWRLRTEDEEQVAIGPLSNTLAIWNRIYQNTARVAEATIRFAIGMVAGAALVVPLVILSYQKSQKSRLFVVISFVSVFCFLLSLFSKASNYETMAASAAYAAVLTIFIGSGPSP